jgi:flavin reductase (DIM6/NTAB) family NADH-FMN oxidoreductase RutF
MVAIDHTCSFLNVFESSGFYAVNILREDQCDLSVRFAELPEGRFTGVSWHPGSTGSPLIDRALCALECRTIQMLDAGDHRVFIAEVMEVEIGEGRPLVFFSGGYAELEP